MAGSASGRARTALWLVSLSLLLPLTLASSNGNGNNAAQPSYDSYNYDGNNEANAGAGNQNNNDGYEGHDGYSGYNGYDGYNDYNDYNQRDQYQSQYNRQDYASEGRDQTGSTSTMATPPPPPPSVGSNSQASSSYGYDSSDDRKDNQNQAAQNYPYDYASEGYANAAAAANGASSRSDATASEANEYMSEDGRSKRDGDDLDGTTGATTSRDASSKDDPSSSAPQYKPPPIHYQFPASDKDSVNDNDKDGDKGADAAASKDFASPRQDTMGRYLSTKNGKLQIAAVSGLLGGSIGAFLTKSIISTGVNTMFVVCCFTWAIMAWFIRNPYGELVRSLGLAFVLLLQQTRRIRRQYPTHRYVVPAIFGISPSRQLRRFPPNNNEDGSVNVWRYEPQSRRDPEFSMLPALVVMTLIGAFCGGSINLPLFPTWLGALGGGAVLALGCMVVPSSADDVTSAFVGDLCRSMGMRVVTMAQELWYIQQDLELIPQVGTVSSLLIDKLLILDGKHKVRKRIATFTSRIYNQILQLQSDSSSGKRGGRDRRDRDDNDRGPPRERGGRRSDPARRRYPRDSDGDDETSRDDFERRDRRRPPRDEDANRNDNDNVDNPNRRDSSRRDRDDGYDDRPRRQGRPSRSDEEQFDDNDSSKKKSRGLFGFR